MGDPLVPGGQDAPDRPLRRAAGARVATEITERKRAETRARELSVELEDRVLARTAELEAANEPCEPRRCASGRC